LKIGGVTWLRPARASSFAPIVVLFAAHTFAMLGHRRDIGTCAHGSVADEREALFEAP
jgi:hypothetical protein